MTKKLTIYEDYSEYEIDGVKTRFAEGGQSVSAKNNIKRIKQSFDNGFLEEVIKNQLENPDRLPGLDDTHAHHLRKLADSVTSEVGRALIGLSIMQLCIKSICPNQNVRLHKGGHGGRSTFSWVDGVSMRTLDKQYITPILRRYGLLSLNAHGFMMTRSLAENYPYTKLYKAAIRGGKEEWMEVVEVIENETLNPNHALQYVIAILINRSREFISKTEKCLTLAKEYLSREKKETEILKFLITFINESEYGARLFEVLVHSIFQQLEAKNQLNGSLKTLTQMRSANKKHKNVGDVEILLNTGSTIILEAWDAKYGKEDLREEVEELSEKLQDHPDCALAGFVANQHLKISEKLRSRIQEIEELHDTKIELLNIYEFFEVILSQYDVSRSDFLKNWLTVFIECICQKRRDQAPIDEPCDGWITDLIARFESSS